MRLYEYLQENDLHIIDWKKFGNGEDDCFINKSYTKNIEDCNLKMAWDEINEWCTLEAENCTEEDAALIIRLYNATFNYILKNKDNIEKCCCYYARCYEFVNHELLGNDIFQKCQFAVNLIVEATCLNAKESNLTLSEVMNYDLNEQFFLPM